MFGAIAAVAGGALGGMFAAEGASDAARIQAGAADRASALSQGQYDQNRADLAPYREAGYAGLTRLRDLLGIGATPNANAEGVRKFTVGDFYNDPVNQIGMQFGLDEGRKGIERSAAARGSLNSGATLKELTRYGTDYAGQRAGESYNRFVNDQTNLYNRYAGIAGTGQNAANTTAAMGTQNANTIGNYLTGAGNARGAAAIAGANAWGGAAGNIGNYFGQSSMLDKILNRGGAAGGGMPYTGYGVNGDYQYG